MTTDNRPLREVVDAVVEAHEQYQDDHTEFVQARIDYRRAATVRQQSLDTRKKHIKALEEILKRLKRTN